MTGIDLGERVLLTLIKNRHLKVLAVLG